MPPCAHTECDRLTGTIENSSTGTPDSATRIVAIRPASPPPTTITFGCLAIIQSGEPPMNTDYLRSLVFIRGSKFLISNLNPLPHVSAQRKPIIVKAQRNHDPHKRHHQCYCRSKPRRHPLRLRAHRNSPLARKIPQPISQME